MSTAKNCSSLRPMIAALLTTMYCAAGILLIVGSTPDTSGPPVGVFAVQK